MRRVAHGSSAIVAGGLSCSPASSTGAASFAVCTSKDGRVRLLGPPSGSGDGLLPLLGEAVIGLDVNCASAGIGRVALEGTVTVAAGGNDGTLRFCAFALGPPGAAGARLLLQRGDSLPYSSETTASGQTASASQQLPPLEASLDWGPRASPLSSVAAHHEAADVVAAGTESGRVAVVSLDFAAGGGARLLWSASGPAGSPILATQWWPHAASTLAVAAGSSVLVADIRAPPPPGSRLFSLPRYSTRGGGGGQQQQLPPAVTCLAFEAAPCSHPWVVWGGTDDGGASAWDLRATGAPLPPPEAAAAGGALDDGGADASTTLRGPVLGIAACAARTPSLWGGRDASSAAPSSSNEGRWAALLACEGGAVVGLPRRREAAVGGGAGGAGEEGVLLGQGAAAATAVALWPGGAAGGGTLALVGSAAGDVLALAL